MSDNLKTIGLHNRGQQVDIAGFGKATVLAWTHNAARLQLDQPTGIAAGDDVRISGRLARVLDVQGDFVRVRLVGTLKGRVVTADEANGG